MMSVTSIAAPGYTVLGSIPFPGRRLTELNLPNRIMDMSVGVVE